MSVGDLLFDIFMYPLEAVALQNRRRALIPRASGRVLEIGAGTGANLPYYRWERVRELHLLDIEPRDAIRVPAGSARVPVVSHRGDAQSLPFADKSFDTVVSTLVFCSVSDQDRGLREAWRVLKDDGLYIFIEHVRPGGRRLARVTDAVNPLWLALNGQCNINRDTLTAIRRAGFAVHGLRAAAGGLLIDGTASRAG